MRQINRRALLTALLGLALMLPGLRVAGDPGGGTGTGGGGKVWAMPGLVQLDPGGHGGGTGGS